MAHRSMMEMEHSDWIQLSGPYFAVRTAQMDLSQNALLCFGLISFELCFEKKLNGNKLVRAETGARKYVLGQQRKSTDNDSLSPN